MATIQGIDTFAHGIFSTAGGGLYDSVFGTPARDTGTVYGSDPASLLIDTSSPEAVRHLYASAPTIVFSVFRFRIPTIPGGQVRIATVSDGTNNLGLNVEATGKTSMVIGGGSTATGSTTLVGGNWYWIEVLLDLSANPWQGTWRIDGGGVEATASLAVAASTGNYAQLGEPGLLAPTNWRYSCWVWGTATSLSDWPGEYVGRAYSPTAVGTHNLDASTSQFFFKNVSAVETALTTVEATSYQAIDDVPLDADSDRVLVKSAAVTAFFDPNGNGTNTAWTGDYTGIDDAVRSPTDASTGGDGASISSGTATALEDTNWGTGTHIAGATYTLYIYSESGAKRGLSVSVDGGANFSVIHVASAAKQWRTLDVSAQVTSQATLDAFAVRWRCDSTAGGSGAGTVTVYAAYLQQVGTAFPATTNYLEYALADSAESTAPAAVRVINSIRNDSGTTANKISAKIRDGASDGAVYTDLNINSATNIYKSAVFLTKPSGGAWTDSAFDALTFRWGFTDDPDSIPRLEGVLLDAVFLQPAPSRALPLPQPSNFQNPAIF